MVFSPGTAIAPCGKSGKGALGLVQLKGSLDYYLYSVGKLLVIEAKNADLAKGFTQLAVELIALD